MAMFDYVMVVTSIIIGLTLTQLLQGVGQLVAHPRRRPVYWVHLLWAAYLFLNAVIWWWFEYLLRDVPSWTFGLYLFVLLQASLMYMNCALLFPKDLHEYQGFRDYYYSRRGWFFGLLMFRDSIDVLDTWLKGPAHFASLGLEYKIVTGVLLTLYFIAMRTRNEIFHGAFAVAALAYQASWAVRVFNTVN